MPQFVLRFVFSSDDVRVLASAGSDVHLGRYVDGAPPRFAWLRWRPFEENEVGWDAPFGLYAAQGLGASGPHDIVATTAGAVDAGYAYAYAPEAGFARGRAIGGACYEIDNDVPLDRSAYLAFGLSQDATVNGAAVAAAPVNGAIVPAASLATFAPSATLAVWLASQPSAYTAGRVRGRPTQLDVPYGSAPATYTYDALHGRFVRATGTRP